MAADGIQGIDCVKRHVNSLMVSRTKKYLSALKVAEMEKNKDYIYYGLFLSETCKLQIERQIERMDGYNKLFETRGKLQLHHCTLLNC